MAQGKSMTFVTHTELVQQLAKQKSGHREVTFRNLRRTRKTEAIFRARHAKFRSQISNLRDAVRGLLAWRTRELRAKKRAARAAARSAS